jgi:Ca-activated chloride channel family protein
MATYITFDRPELLWFLATVPLLIFTHLYFIHHARRKAILFGNFSTLTRITGKKVRTLNLVLLAVRLLVVTAIVFAIAGATLWRSGVRSDNDVILLLDASASMATRDMGTSRLEAAKDAARLFIDDLEPSMRIGVVQYSGLSMVVTEPTIDRSAIRRGIAAVELKPIGGSDIAGAIVTGSNLLASSERGRVLVVLSDGVAALSLYDDNPIPQAIAYARDRGVVIHTIGVGTQRSGSFIPTLEAEAALFDEQNLQIIANGTGGVYAWARDPSQLKDTFARIAEERERAQIPLPLSDELFIVVLFAVLVEWGLINTRYRILP